MEGIRSCWVFCWQRLVLLVALPLTWFVSCALRFYQYVNPDWALADHVPGPASKPLPSRQRSKERAATVRVTS